MFPRASYDLRRPVDCSESIIIFCEINATGYGTAKSMHMIRRYLALASQESLKELGRSKNTWWIKGQLLRCVRLLDWEGKGDSLPVRTTKEQNLDRDREDLALKLSPNIKGSDMRQPNGHWAGVDTDYDVALELRTFYLELAVECLETDKCLDIDGELDRIDATEKLWTERCQRS